MILSRMQDRKADQEQDVITQADLSRLMNLLMNARDAKQDAEKEAEKIGERRRAGASIEPGDIVFDPNERLPYFLVDGMIVGAEFAPGTRSNETLPARMGIAPLTHRRLLIIWVWLAAFVAMGIFPPWTTRSGYTRGYGFIFSPPNQAVHLDQSRLVVQWMIITLIAGVLYFVWPSPKNQQKF